MKITIKEIRKINLILKNRFEFDFSEYAFFFYKRLLENFMSKNNFKTVDEFVRYIYAYDKFGESLREELLVPETELFRDPSMWEYLRKMIFPKLKQDLPFKIWIPEASTGEELYSLLIVLKESNLIDNVEILVSSSSGNHLKKIKKGVLRNVGFENQEANYKRYNGVFQLKKYFDFVENKTFLKKELLSNVQFIEHAIWQPIQVNKLQFVLFRNKILYYTSIMQSRVLRNITSNLVPGGKLVIGAKENIENYLVDLELGEINIYEKIYKKVIRR